MQDAAITLRFLGSAFDDDAGGRAISHPLLSLLVEGCPCGADLSSAFGAPLLQGATLLACKNGICEKNQYSLKYENTASLTFPFHPAAGANLRPFGAPPSNGRRENAAHRRLPHMGRVAIGEYPFSPLSSFRANARNLFRSRSSKSRRTTGSGKHRVP